MKFRKSQLVAPIIAAALVGCGGQTAIVGEEHEAIGQNGGASNDDSSNHADAGTPPDSSAPGSSDDVTDNGGTDDGGTGNGGTGNGGTGNGGTGNGGTGNGGTGNGVTDDNSNLPQLSCGAVASQQFDATSMQAYSVAPEVQTAVDHTLGLMSPAQKASQLMGVPSANRDYRDIQRSPEVEVPGLGVIRGYRYRDGVRGVNLDAGQDNRTVDGYNFATAFPSPALRAASWDLALERRIGAAIGDETAASRNNALLGPGLTLLRHPYWGRSQESYGEAPYLVGRMGTAFAVGVQEYVVACAKSFAANNIERQRAQQDAVMSEQSLREIYTRQFEMVVQDAGVGCVLAAYNLVNGQKMTQNQHLLRDVLKAPLSEGGMGFKGFVISDWWAMPGNQEVPNAVTAQAIANDAIEAGLDVELPWQLHYTPATLANVNLAHMDEAVRRVLTQKYRFNTANTDDGWGKQTPTSSLTEDGSIAANDEHEALAEEAVVKSAVLLSNGVEASAPVLPLGSVEKVAVVGPAELFRLVSSSVPKSCGRYDDDPGQSSDDNPRECTFQFATDPALGDRGSTRVNADPDRSVGPFAGIAAAAGDERVVTSGDSPEAAADADAVVVVVGYTPENEGEEYPIAEGGDRSSLNLPDGQYEFVQAVLDLNKPTIIIVESGSIVNLPWLTHENRNQATIWAGYPGARGGLALGKLIFGAANFSGKLPMAWPHEAELNAFKDSETSTTMPYFFGYRAYDQRKYVDGVPVELVFPFGHGLSYSVFEYANLGLPCESVTKDAVFNVSVDITNTSSVDADEVAMLFVKPPPKPNGATGERPWKELKSFARVSVPAGKTVTAKLPLRVRDLRRWEGDTEGNWTIDEGEYTIVVAKNAEDAETSSNVGVLVVGDD